MLETAFILFTVGLCPARASQVGDGLSFKPMKHYWFSKADPPNRPEEYRVHRSLTEQQVTTDPHLGGTVGWENKPEFRNPMGLGSSPTSLKMTCIWSISFLVI